MFKETEYKILKNILLEVTEKYDQILNQFSSVNRELKSIKHIDNITNVYSKEGFLERLTALLKKAERENNHVAVIIADLDNFKYINDVYGHTLGDIYLSKIASLIEDTLPPNAFMGRIAGDSFGIAIYGGEFKDYIIFVEKLLKKVSKFYLKVGNSFIKTTFSIGISIYPQDGKDPKLLLASSEQAMYVSKSKGRNTYTIFNKDISRGFLNIEKYKSMLNKAIGNKSVIPYIQPIFNLEKKKIIGGEVLLRIEIDRKIYPAGIFIDVAEKFGFIDELESILFEKILQPPFLSVFKGRFLFLNKTIKSEKKAEEAKKVIDTLAHERRKYHFVPVIEITESSFVEYFSIISEFISYARSKNIKIALDDFGAGYASFSYLLNFDIDILKIDGNLIKNILKNKKSASIVRAISQIAKDFKIKTVGEYAESSEILYVLEMLGIHCAQGYYISKPLPFEKFKEIVS